MENQKSKSLTEILGFDPSKVDNEKVQKLIKDDADRRQQAIDAWAKREKELTARKPISEQHRATELKLERSVVDSRDTLETHRTATRIANELGIKDKMQSLAEQRPALARENEMAVKTLADYNHTQEVQQRLSKVQGGSESFQCIAQAHTKFANDLAQGGAKANDELIARTDAVRDNASLSNPVEATQVTQQPSSHVVVEQSPAASQKPEQPTTQSSDSDDLLKRYQGQGEISSQTFYSRGNHYESDMGEWSRNRIEEHRDVLKNIDEKLMTDDQIAAVDDPEERDRLKSVQVTDATSRKRLELVRDLEVNNYEATTCNQAANLCRYNGGKANLEDADRMTSEAGRFEQQRDAALKALDSFDQKQAQAEGQFKRAADKPEAVQPGAATQTQSEAEGTKMIKSSEIEAPKNAAATRFAERAKASEEAGAKATIDPALKERFAQTQARAEAAKQVQQQKQSEREATKQRPASM